VIELVVAGAAILVNVSQRPSVKVELFWTVLVKPVTGLKVNSKTPPVDVPEVMVIVGGEGKVIVSRADELVMEPNELETTTL